MILAWLLNSPEDHPRLKPVAKAVLVAICKTKTAERAKTSDVGLLLGIGSALADIAQEMFVQLMPRNDRIYGGNP
ncbi:hypothetical protein HFO27_18105 [Rhizobium leguminosarum]|uniref:hypothetical protein n=1 Tax=Rhizobium leguminosarum TaxID=384 RepID=UPI001C90531A|nr:hypothetical protein [Rhizobium leguminosarum]MBY3176537.1 hypothetical protein [Rhizobium leguminosarum]